jgi:hypothetical protein
MDARYKGTLGSGHLERLKSFETHAGQVTPGPDSLPSNRCRGTSPKEIFRPKGLDYILSIKMMPRYHDREPKPAHGKGRLLSYHEETADSYANRDLKKFIDDSMPGGVIHKNDSVS